MSCGKRYKSVGRWRHGSEGNVPEFAYLGGLDLEDVIYVGRAEHDGDIVPGKIVPSHNCCYIPHGGKEVSKETYQVLCNPDDCLGEWVPASNGEVPNGALQGGVTSDGEALYIGRVEHEGTLTVGKVHPSHECVYVPFGGSEHKYTEYEVLVCKTVPLITEGEN